MLRDAKLIPLKLGYWPGFLYLLELPIINQKFKF